MQKFLLFFLLLAMFSCSVKESEVEKQNFVPQAPDLSEGIMTPELLWSFGRLGGVQVSPDGKAILYTVTYYDIEENRSYRDVYTIPVSGGEPENLTNSTSNESNAMWRPDGERIGFLSSASGTSQLWEMDADGSDLHQVSEIDGGISGFKYSPDGSKIFYTKSVKLDESVHEKYPDLPKTNARIETDLMYRHWDEWHNYAYNHIFVTDYNEDQVNEGTDIMKGERYDSPMKPFGGIEQISWTPDGKTIAYTCKKKAGKEYSLSTNSDIYFYDVETGETTNFTEGMMGYDKNPVFSPDGRYMAWESMEREGYESDKNRLFMAD